MSFAQLHIDESADKKYEINVEPVTGESRVNLQQKEVYKGSKFNNYKESPTQSFRYALNKAK